MTTDNTDITSLCNRAPITLIEALANCVYATRDGVRYLNLICKESNCSDEQAVTCAEVGLEFENVLVNSIFGVDDCGKFGLKIGGECIASLLELIQVET